MPLDPTSPNPPDPFACLDELLEEQRLRDLDRDQHRRDKFGSKPTEEFATPSHGSSVEEATLEQTRRRRWLVNCGGPSDGATR